MKYKSYALLLPLVLTAFFIIKNNSHQSDDLQSLAASESNENIKTKNKLATNTKPNDKQIKNEPTNRITVPDSNEPFISNTSTATQSISNTEPEPTNRNTDMAAAGEFADEVNLQHSENDCEGSCDGENTEIAGSESVNAPATGEFADQINLDAIFAQAQQKDANLQPEVKLADPSEGAPPTTEIGAYTPPQ